MLLSSLYQLNKIQKYPNSFENNKKYELIEINSKEKVRINTQQMNIDIFSNLILLEFIDYLLHLLQTKMSILNNSKLEDITYQKTLLIIITSSSSRFDIKRYEEIKKSTKGSGENCNTACLLIRL